ncbi:MAG: fumarylacetoacetate hydrolase family protein [Gemmatimonadaceae bacterium]
MPMRPTLWLLLLFACVTPAAAHTQGTVHYVRYASGSETSYGILEGETIRELKGDLFAGPTPTGKRLRLADVRLLAPVTPSKVIAVGLNYKSHLGERPSAAYPGLFAKLPTSIIATDEEIVLPPDATNAHYEGEMVVVIGRRASNVSVEDAARYVFGITAGNDVSERDWQKNDLQWFRAKAADTFGPLGPAIVTGLPYDDLLLQTRLNGEVVQSQRTKDLIFNVSEIVSYVSRYVTLIPGDVIYSGTPGTTRPIHAGDVVEVEVEGVGVLRNKVAKRR